jgi:hypothetical protein
MPIEPTTFKKDVPTKDTETRKPNTPEKLDNKPSKKMKAATVNDGISKGKTMVGKTEENPSGKPDAINLHPIYNSTDINSMFDKHISVKTIQEINHLIDVVEAEYDRNNSHYRDSGTNSLVDIYKNDTPGQGVKMDYKLRFKDPKQDKEAMTRSGQKRNRIDMVPRKDPSRDRHLDGDFYRQQSAYKKVIETKMTPWEKMVKAMPRLKDSEERAQQAKAGLKKANDDYQAILDKEAKKKVDEEFTEAIAVRQMVRIHKPLTDLQKQRALMLAKQKGRNRPSVGDFMAAREEYLPEVGDTPRGQERLKKNELRAVARAGAAAGEEIMSNKGYDPKAMKKNINIFSQARKRIKEEADDPVEQLRSKLSGMKDTSYSAIDKVMLDISDTAGIQSNKLHKDWVKKYGVTPDTWIKKQKQDVKEATTWIDGNPHHRSDDNEDTVKAKKLKKMDLNKMFQKEAEEVWDKPNPNKHHHHLSPAKKALARARAKAAGRPYPNMVDNMAVAKEEYIDGCPIDEQWELELGLTEDNFTVSGFELYEDWNELEEEAEHQGKKVRLGKPFLTPGGPKKRAVYVKNGSGNVVKVNFGDPHLSIKRDQPSRKSSYRARHHCETPGPRWKANYWSCKYWSSTPTSTLDKG